MNAQNRGPQLIDELLELDEAVMTAIGAKDVGALEPMLADAFVLRTPGAADVDKIAFLQAIQNIPGDIQSIRGEGTKAAVFGGVGVVTGVQVAVVKLGADGSIVTNRGAYTDVFESVDGRWQLVLAFSVELGTDKVE